MNQYKTSRQKYFDQDLYNFDEIDTIIDFFKKNKISLVKMSYQIDFKGEAQQTEFDGFM